MWSTGRGRPAEISHTEAEGGRNRYVAEISGRTAF